MNDLLQELNEFVGKASLATYAGGGAETKSQRPGFRELEFAEGDWEYRDSYAGFFRSWGQEVVRHQGKPFWNQIYGGGMSDAYIQDEPFALETFGFLMKSLSAGEKKDSFQPRGPESFTDGDWQYSCDWSGDITSFKGEETILHRGEIVFTHTFLGGLILDR
ncbi:hypothetical protein KA012_03035 [Candidatus Woesebacteria bacterium]|nr:hypothetical protein [Candidatus Woesebacteria bacterium]